MKRSQRRQSGRMIAAKASIATAALAAVLAVGPGAPAQAEEHMLLADKIDVGGNGLGVFDISFVDPVIDLYVLADRTNASVDFFDASDPTFIGRVGGFQGVQSTTSKSGPDGVVVVDHKEVWAGDGDSTVKIIDIATFQIVAQVSTGGKFRCDEMAWDSRDHILAVANNADAPPFVTLINTDTRTITGKITFDGTNGTPDATNGIEQPQWSPVTGLFYISVPVVPPQAGSSDSSQGGVSVIDPNQLVIDPNQLKVTGTFPVQNCMPAGLALGPRNEALLGCSASFGTKPKVLTQSVIMNIRTGDIRANITQVGGSDEVWYDAGSKHYYLAARANQDRDGNTKPVLGVIDANTNVWDGNKRTWATAHSVAADRVSRYVFVPIGFVPPGSPPGTDPTNPCPKTGCIAVYLPSGSDDDDGTRQSMR